MFLTVPFALNWMKENDWPLIQKRNRLLKAYGIDLLCKITGNKPLLLSTSDPLTQFGSVLLPADINTDHMKDWLYDQRNIEVVVHKWLGKAIIRFSVHAHTSLEDIQTLERGVREYIDEFINKIAKL